MFYVKILSLIRYTCMMGKTSSAGKTKKMEALELCFHGGMQAHERAFNYPYIMSLT